MKIAYIWRWYLVSETLGEKPRWRSKLLWRSFLTIRPRLQNVSKYVSLQKLPMKTARILQVSSQFRSRTSYSFLARMSTFDLSNTSPTVPVSLPSNLTQEQLLSFPAFKTWLSTLQHSLSLQSKDKSHAFNSSPYSLCNIEVQTVDYFGGNRLGFVKLKARVENDQGEHLPGSVLLRGGSVGMMVWILPTR